MNRRKNKKVRRENRGKELVKKNIPEFNLYLIIASLSIGCLTFITYKGALDNQFVSWDDPAYVINNDLVRPDILPHKTSVEEIFRRVVSLNYHPLTIITLRSNNNSCPDCIDGISAKPFILWNIILHSLNSILVFLLLFRMTKKNLLASLIVAVIFALHPMHVESVVWVSERKDVLYAFFFLTGLLAYTKYLMTKNTKWIILTFLLFILACLSKAVAVVFPIVMLILYYWYDKSGNGFKSFRSVLKKTVFKHTLPFFVVSIIFGLIAVNVQRGGDFGGLLENNSDAVAINSFDIFSIIQRIQFASYGFLKYLIKFFIPNNLCTYYPYPDQISFDHSIFYKVAPFLVIAILAIVIISIKYTKSMVVGMGFFTITIVLVLQFISVGTVIIADRYTYLPYIGFAFTLVMLIAEFVSKTGQKLIYTVMLVLILALIPKTRSQIRTWHDTDTLWSNVIATQSKDGNILTQSMDKPLSIRGTYYAKMAEKAKTPKEKSTLINKALKDFNMAIDLHTTRPDVYEKIGNVYAMLKEYPKAQENYSKAIALAPKNGSVYFNRAVTYSIMGEYIKAINDFSRSLEYVQEKAPLIHVYRGIAYFNVGKRTEAAEDFEKALEYDPNNSQAKEYLDRLKSLN